MATNLSAQRDKDGIYHLEGELSIHGLDQLKDLLERSVRAGGGEVCISLEKVRFLDTACLQLFLAFKKRLEPDRKFRITAVSAEVERILSLSGLKPFLLG